MTGICRHVPSKQTLLSKGSPVEGLPPQAALLVSVHGAAQPHEALAAQQDHMPLGQRTASTQELQACSYTIALALHWLSPGPGSEHALLTLIWQAAQLQAP